LKYFLLIFITLNLSAVTIKINSNYYTSKGAASVSRSSSTTTTYISGYGLSTLYYVADDWTAYVDNKYRYPNWWSSSSGCDEGDILQDNICITPPPPDSDGDGTPDKCDRDYSNYFNEDCDGDGIPNATDPSEDIDGDGIPNSEDIDDDNDGIPDEADGTAGQNETSTSCSVLEREFLSTCSPLYNDVKYSCSTTSDGVSYLHDTSCTPKHDPCNEILSSFQLTCKAPNIISGSCESTNYEVTSNTLKCNKPDPEDDYCTTFRSNLKATCSFPNYISGYCNSDTDNTLACKSPSNDLNSSVSDLNFEVIKDAINQTSSENLTKLDDLITSQNDIDTNIMDTNTKLDTLLANNQAQNNELKNSISSQTDTLGRKIDTTNEKLDTINDTLQNLDINNSTNIDLNTTNDLLSSINDKLNNQDPEDQTIQDDAHGNMTGFIGDVQTSLDNIQTQFDNTKLTIENGFTFTPSVSTPCDNPTVTVFGSDIEFDICGTFSVFYSIFYLIFTIVFTWVAIQIYILGFRI
jgi:hypothetical protein